MDIATGTRTQLVEHLSPQPQVGRPSWSPDGTKIMVTDNDRVNPRFREGYNKLRVIDIATKRRRGMPSGRRRRRSPTARKAQRCGRPTARRSLSTSDSVLKVMPTNADGSPSGPAVQITNEVSDMPSWQADSQTLLYMSAGKLKKIKVDGTGQQNVPLRMTYTPAAPTGTTIIHAGQLWWGGSPVMKSNVDIIIKGKPDRLDRAAPVQSSANSGDYLRRRLAADGAAGLVGSALPSTERLPGQPVQTRSGQRCLRTVHVGAVGGGPGLREHRDP